MINVVDAGPDRDLLCKAAGAVIDVQNAGVQVVQRKLHLGYARAARLLELLEVAGVVGPWVPGGRLVLVSPGQKAAAVDAIRKDVAL